MLQPSNQTQLVQYIIRNLNPIHATIRDTCKSLGIDVEAAEDAAACSGYNGTKPDLPWLMTPAEYAQNAVDMIALEVPLTADYDECSEILTEGFDIWNSAQWGYLVVALAFDYQEWPDMCKDVAITYTMFCTTGRLLSDADDAVIEGSEEQGRGAYEAVKAWMVYNILAVEALQRYPLSHECKHVLDEMLKRDVGTIAESYGAALQASYLAQGHPLRDVEDILLRLGAERPDIGDIVGILLTTWSAAVMGEVKAIPAFTTVVAGYLRGIHSVPSLDGAEIASDAAALVSEFSANLSFAHAFEALTNQPEWSNPVEGARELVSAGLYNVTFVDEEGVFGQKSLRLLQRVADGMSDKPSLIIPSAELGLVSPDSDSLEGILSGLRDYVSTGRRDFAVRCGVSPDRQERLGIVIEALDLMRDTVGPGRIHLIPSSDISRCTNSNLFTEGMLLTTYGTTGNVDLPSIHITFMADEPDEEVGSQVRRDLENSSSALSVRKLINLGIPRFVLPLLAQRLGGADQEGFVGFKALTVLGIAKQKGYVSDYSDLKQLAPPTLRIHRVSDREEDEDTVPVAEHDLTLTPSR